MPKSVLEHVYGADEADDDDVGDEGDARALAADAGSDDEAVDSDSMQERLAADTAADGSASTDEGAADVLRSDLTASASTSGRGAIRRPAIVNCFRRDYGARSLTCLMAGPNVPSSRPKYILLCLVATHWWYVITANALH